MTGCGGDGGSYYSLRGFETQATIINGMPGLTNGKPTFQILKRSKSLRDHQDHLAVRLSIGGLINTVTKKPHETFGGEIS
ncbi:MAG: hypothetical protein QM762_13470 [Chryseolinea sp.]